MSEGAVVGDKIVRTFNDTNYFAKGTYKRDFVQLFSSATLANFFTKTLLAPLERWRIIKQTQPAYELRPSKFTSFAQYVRKLEASANQGWTALWRGNAANLWLHTWQILAQVTLFDSLRASFSEWSFDLQNQPISRFLVESVAAPFVAAATALAITHPIDTARVRISMNYYRNPKEMLFTGVTSCWSLIRLEERSMRGIYRGYLLASVIGVLHLNLYAGAKKLWEGFGRQEQLEEFGAKEVVASIAALLLLHPLDTIKKNLQLNNQSRPKMFDNSLHVLAYYREHLGIDKLYQGLSVTLVRQALYCPIFALSLAFLQQKVNPF